jgi:hypothetical protein
MATTELRRELEAVRLLLASRLDAMSDTSDSRLTTLQEAIKTARYDRDRDINALREIIEARLNEAEKDTGRRIDAYSLLPGEIQGDRDRAIAALRELLESRLAAMDKATELLAATVGRVPSDTDKQVNALRELLGARIDGMDVATKLLAESVAKFPSDMDRSVAATRELIQSEIVQVEAVSNEKFAAIDGTFSSNALALTAALAAQKEAAAEQNKSNTLAITKSEQATKETISANAAQTSNSLASQAATIADLKDRIVRIESGGVARTALRNEDRQGETYQQAATIAQAEGRRQNMAVGVAGFSALIALVAVILLVTHGG